jgi:hypothetical protein
MAPKSSAEEEYISSFLKRSVVAQIANESARKSNDDHRGESVAVEEVSSNYTFVSYEEYCRAKRKRNEQFLTEALQVAQQLKQHNTAMGTSIRKKRIVSSSALATANTRRITRSLNKRMKLRSGKEVNDQSASTGVEESVEADNESQEIPTGITRERMNRRHWSKFSSSSASDQSNVLVRDVTHELDDDWIAKMHTFLLQVPHGQGQSKKTVSHTNAERVIAKVRQLMSGEGITYHHWPEGIVFGENLHINILSTNFSHLMDEAIEFEERYGRDLGNGWLLRHPIEKLRLYQEYLLENKKISETGGPMIHTKTRDI